jgi:ElaB/YqjD/DUF883 family membrane-anchored ribosome-binding protein
MLIEEVIKQCEENEAVGLVELDTKQLADWLRELMQLRYNLAKSDYDEVRGRLQTANLIKDEQKAKADKLLSCLKCLVMRDLIKDCPEKKAASEIVKEYDFFVKE